MLLRTSQGLEREGFQVYGPQARQLAALILGAPADLVVLEARR